MNIEREPGFSTAAADAESEDTRRRPVVVVLDHGGVGTWRSAQKALEHVGADAPHTRNLDEISQADGLVLPGQGAFPSVMEKLHAHDLIEPLEAFRARGKPILGICLGAQLMFEHSEENGQTEGLGWFSGEVKTVPGIRINIGWLPVDWQRESPLQEGIPEQSFYHLHMYAAQPTDSEIILATASRGSTFVTAVASENVFGVQFHPEKSSAVGLALLENFVNLCRPPAEESHDS